MRGVGEALIAVPGRKFFLTLFLAAGILLFTAPVLACPGDCDGDDVVPVSEMVVGLNIALGRQPLSSCPSSDIDASAEVTVDELVAIVRVVLYGCFATPLPSRTPRSTPTPRPNHPPVLESLPVYPAYPNQEIRFIVPASDPDGDSLRYRSDDLPSGATLDETTGEFHWVPAEPQVGVVSVPISVTDDGRPPLGASDFLLFAVHPLDGCAILDCDPVAGCSASLPDADVHCCIAGTLPRVFEPPAECPNTPTLFLGRNAVGFGPLQNCDELRVRNFSQGGAAVLLNLQARCLDATAPILVHSVMDSTTRFLFEDSRLLQFRTRDDGFAEYKFLQLAVEGFGPFDDLQGQEANLSVTLTDADGTTAREEVRLRLTFTPIPDLPEAADR